MESYAELNGIYIERIQKESNIKLFDVIRDNVKKNVPTIIHLDTYYSTWGFLYLKEHSNHVAMVVGIDDNKVYILDPDYSDTEIFPVDYSLLTIATSFYYEITVKHPDKLSYEDLLGCICKRKKDYKIMIKNIAIIKGFYIRLGPMLI